MYAYIEGTLAEKDTGTMVVDAHGVGYLITVTGRALAAAPAVGQRCRVYTRLLVREDALELIGFESREERRMFDKLTSVNGVGTKMAMGLLSATSTKDLALALATGDVAALKRLPGVGAKIAQRLVLELREKVEQTELVGEIGASAVPEMSGDAENEASAALMALGYSSAEAARAVALARKDNEDASVNTLVRMALRVMDSGR